MPFRMVGQVAPGNGVLGAGAVQNFHAKGEKWSAV